MAQWIDAVAEDALQDGGRTLLFRQGRQIALFRVQGRYYALDDSCPHAGSSLAAGKLDGLSITCRAHGLRFDLATGCMRGMTDFGARTYPVRVHDGRVQIEIDLPPQHTPTSDPASA